MVFHLVALHLVHIAAMGGLKGNALTNVCVYLKHLNIIVCICWHRVYVASPGTSSPAESYPHRASHCVQRSAVMLSDCCSWQDQRAAQMILTDSCPLHAPRSDLDGAAGSTEDGQQLCCNFKLQHLSGMPLESASFPWK